MVLTKQNIDAAFKQEFGSSYPASNKAQNKNPKILKKGPQSLAKIIYFQKSMWK